MSAYLDLVKERRTSYAIGKNTELSNEEISEYLLKVAREIPSANNSQTTRLVIVYGDEHVQLWDHILEVQKDVLEGEMWEMMSGVMEGAKAGVGTVLFFEDLDAVAAMPAQGAREEAYKQNNNANTQYAIWLAMTELGLGGSLQHMNIGFEQGFDKSIKEMFDLPENWEMIAQMPFGSIEAPTDDKDYIEDEERVLVFGE